MAELGHCHYCGEMAILDYPETATQEEKNKMATKYCKCTQAANESEKEIETEKAKERIEQLFGENAIEMGFDSVLEQEINDLLNKIIELISNNYMRGATIEIDGSTKAKISISSKGKINIERIQAIKYKLEV